MDLEPLAPERIPEAALLLRRAFDADPMFRFLLPGERARGAWVTLVMASALEECLTRGAIWSAHLDALAGTIAVIPPGHAHASLTRRVGRMIRLLATTPTVPPPPRFLLSGPRVLSLIASHHPAEPHLYVQVLGADPSFHGRGVGAALIEKALECAAATGVFAYLETTNPKNLAFYRRFGFHVTEQVDPSPGGGPPIWMLRT